MSRRITAVLTAAAVTVILVTGGASSANRPGQQPPRNLTPPTITGTARVSNPLTTSTGTWQGKSLRFAYQWLRCDSAGANCSAIGGATVSTYTVTTADVDHTLRVIATATNRYGSAAATSAPTAVIQGTPPPPPPPPPPPVPPSNTAPPTINGTVQQGQTLTSSTGTWSGSTPMTYSYQWQRCDTSGAACAPISGATTSSYVLVLADVGSTIRVSVTASNSAGSATASSVATVVVNGTSTATSSGIGLIRYGSTMCSTSSQGAYGLFDVTSDVTSWTCAARNQAALALGYYNPSMICINQDDGIRYTLANNGSHEDWFLHDANGNRIVNGTNGGANCYLPDLGITSLQDEFKTHIAAVAATIPGADGFFFDNPLLNWNSFTARSGDPVKYPIDPSTHRSPGWEASVKSFLGNVGPSLKAHGYYVASNLYGWCSQCAGASDGSLNNWWWRYLTDANGHSFLSAMMVEQWIKPAASSTVHLVGTSSWTQYWDQFENFQNVARSIGADFQGEDSVAAVGNLNPATVARFGRATFLLDYDCGHGAYVWNSYSTDPWNTINHTVIGCPTGAKYQVVTNVWRRDFANGYVIVNPTSSTVTVGGHTIASGDAVIQQT
jgi:hypothetical protein